MKCEQFREIAQELARDEMRDSADLGDALAHAESCPECDALLESQESLTLALRTLLAHHAGAGASARVEGNLLRALAKQRTPAARGANLAWLPRNRWVVAGFAGVAVAALLIIASAPRTRPAIQRLRSAARLSISAGRQVPGERGLALDASLSADPTSVAAPTPGQEEWASPFGVDDTESEPFVPLSDTFDPASLGDDTVVRVVVPRETLEDFGVPLGEDVNGQVVADVIITNDGTPQAIRVLSW